MIENSMVNNSGDGLFENENQSIYIQNVIDSLRIELPTFDQIMNMKEIGIKNIRVNEISRSLENSDIKEILNYEKSNLLNKKEMLGDLPKYKYRLAILYEKTGEKEKANEILKEIGESLENSFFHHKLALSILEKDFNLGVNELKKENIDEAYISLALAYLQKGDLTTANKYISYAYEKYDYNPRINSVYALILELLGQYQKSICLLREVIRMGNLSQSIYYLLSMNYVFLKNMEKAYYYCNISNHINPLNKDSLILLCQISHRLKKFDTLGKKLEQYLKYNPNDTSIWSNIALVNYYKDNIDESKKALNAIIALDENEYTAWNNLALVSIKENDLDKADRCFAQALVKCNNVFEQNVLLNYFKFLFKNKKYEKLCLLYEEFGINKNAILEKEKAFPYHELYIYSKNELHEYSTYIGLLNEIKNIYKENLIPFVKVLNNIICFFSTVDYNYSKESKENLLILENIIKKEKLSIEEYNKSINNIIFAYLEYNDLEKVEEYIDLFRSRIDKSPYFNATYGLYYFRKGNNEKGEKYYEKAIVYCNNSELKNKLIRKRDLEIARYYLNKSMEKQAEEKIMKILKDNKEDDFLKEQAEMLRKML